MKQFTKKILKENKSVMIAVVMVFLIGTLLGTVSHAKEQADNISKNFVRFHIVANSNSDADQSVKMKVREAIFENMDFSRISSKEEALLYFKKHREEIKQIADRVLLENGFSYDSYVSVGKKEFPVREYSDFVLPWGTYDAVSVTLGEGKGENFFCVMYPSLCRIDGITEITESDRLVLHHILTEQEADLITGNKKETIFKFKILELWEKYFS